MYQTLKDHHMFVASLSCENHRSLKSQHVLSSEKKCDCFPGNPRVFLNHLFSLRSRKICSDQCLSKNKLHSSTAHNTSPVIHICMFLSMSAGLRNKPSVTLYHHMRRQQAVASTLSVRATCAQATPSYLPTMTWSKSTAYSMNSRGQRSRLLDCSRRQLPLLLLLPHLIEDLGKPAASSSLSRSAGLNRKSCT